ncbi:MAG: hypothetical protein IJZ08_05535 [Clostridia bacterium]|nr:hypothetical protein [Clostridia bacterium]
MKKQTISFNICMLVILNIVFWVSYSYPKYIVDWTSIVNVFSLSLLCESFLRLLFYGVYFSFLILAVTKNKTIFSQHIFRSDSTLQGRNFVGKLLALILVQVSFDLLCAIFEIVVPYGMRDVCVVLEWIIVYAVLVKGRLSFIKNKKAVIVASSVLIVALGIKICFSVAAFEECVVLNEKYLFTSPYLRQFIQNTEFIQSIRDMLFDTVIGSTFIICHAVSTAPRDSEESDHTYPHLQAHTRTRQGVIWCIRFFLLCVIVVVLCVVKFMIYPNNSIAEIKRFSMYQTHNELDSSFYVGQKETTRIFRMDGRSSKRTVYQIETIQLFCNQQKVAVLKALEHNPMFQCYPSDVNITITEYTIEDTEVYLYKNAAISFVENGKPRTVNFQDLKTCEENLILIKTVEWLISEGNVIAFEYGCEYLYRYDRDFIVPYIERYAAAQFTPEESMLIVEAYYRPEYLAGLAQKIGVENE